MVTWFVVFEDIAPESPARLLRTLLASGRQHCWAFKDTEVGMLLVNLNCGYLEVELVGGLPASVWASHCRENGMTVVPVTVSLDARRGRLRWTNCVSIVRALLGLHARPWQTPHGLHRQLVGLDSLTRSAAP